MPTSHPKQYRKISRKIAICTAAIAVCVLPAGCDIAGYSAAANQVESPGGGGHVGHSGSAETVTDQVVVPVGVQSPTGQRRGDEDRDRQGDQQQGQQEGQQQEGQQEGEQQGDQQQGEQQEGDQQEQQQEGQEQEGGAEQVNGLDLLGRDCSNSDLEIHDGFQAGPRCIETQFGEVSAADQGPQLLITDAPETVGVDEEFTLSVSTRNLVRDRFLGAAAGGYYLERSFLNDDGLQRGHFHSACRMLESTDEAPQPEKADFFLATQDNRGGAAPDTVEIQVSGLPSAGTAQCAVWAGDGSHRIPMMELVDQIPAFDTVDVTVQ